MKIKLANISDIPQIMEVISDAKNLLKQSGSLQWNTDSYPNEETFINDINNHVLYKLLPLMLKIYRKLRNNLSR